MQYWYDTEFQERGPRYPIDLISIGIVCEDGREYYAQSCEFSTYQVNPWVAEHVLPHLALCPHHTGRRDEDIFTSERLRSQMSGHAFLGGRCWDVCMRQYTDCPWRTREQLQEEILDFLDPEQYGKPELWGYYSSYDWVVFCQLFGTMVDLPRGFPRYTRDVKQWCDMLGNPTLPPQKGTVHHALDDARWTRAAWEVLNRRRQEKRG